MEATSTSSNKNNLWLIIGVTVIVTALVIGLSLYGLGFLNNPSSQMPMAHSPEMIHTEGMDHDAHMNGRQAEVAELGRQVMPFDLERTTHIFEKQDFGGIQQVLSDDDDSEQIALIQTHLKAEATRFQQGDFADPAMIHGEGMPGLAALQAGYEQIEIAYADLPTGAQVTYIAETPELIEAIHLWFDAQLSDHGDHATDSR